MTNKEAPPFSQKRSQKFKTKAIPNEEGPQFLLFNRNGLVPFRPLVDAVPVAPVDGKYKVGDMKVLLKPAPTDPTFALTLVTDNLVLLKQAKKQWIDCPEGVGFSFSLDSWTCNKCSITVRSCQEKGAIRATYSRGDDHLELSIPCRSSWPDCGLSWLLSDERCCSLDVNNPTPWLGKQCGCK